MSRFIHWFFAARTEYQIIKDKVENINILWHILVQKSVAKNSKVYEFPANCNTLTKKIWAKVTLKGVDRVRKKGPNGLNVMLHELFVLAVHWPKVCTLLWEPSALGGALSNTYLHNTVLYIRAPPPPLQVATAWNKNKGTHTRLFAVWFGFSLTPSLPARTGKPYLLHTEKKD